MSRAFCLSGQFVAMTGDANPTVERGLCGSWLACDGGGEFTIAIAGKPAPTFDPISTHDFIEYTQTNVGAGLLANAVGQSIHLVTDKPHSRTSRTAAPTFDPISTWNQGQTCR